MNKDIYKWRFHKQKRESSRLLVIVLFQHKMEILNQLKIKMLYKLD